MATQEYQGLDQFQLDQTYGVGGGMEVHGLTFESAAHLGGGGFGQLSDKFEEFAGHDQEQAGGHMALAYPEQVVVGQMEVCAHPKFEKLVRLVYDARLQGEDPQRRRVLEAQKASAVQDLESCRSQQGASSADPEADIFLDNACNIVEEFMREVHLYSCEADNTCSLFKKQIASILSAGGVRASMQVCQGDEKELRTELKRKYSETIVQLKADFSARKKKGKLPNEATGALKSWWDANLVWPYPSEDEKKSLEDQTGLTATQINNWFINQRKRHWHKYFKDGRLPQTHSESRSVLKEHGFNV